MKTKQSILPNLVVIISCTIFGAVALPTLFILHSKYSEYKEARQNFYKTRMLTTVVTNTYRWQGTMVVFTADDLSIVPDVKIGLRGDGVVVWTTNATKYGQP